MKKLLLTLSIAAFAVCFFALGICASPICAEGEHDGVWSLKADESYVTDAYAREICAKCNLVLSEEIISPIITPKGFSAFMDSIVQGYSVDASALKRYEELTGQKIRYGFVTASTTYGTDKPINADGTATHERVLFEDLTERGSLNLDIKIANISDIHKDARIVFCTYIIVDDKVIYINNDMADTTVCGFTYNEIISYLEDKTTLPSIYKYKKLTFSQLDLQFMAYWNSSNKTSRITGNSTALPYAATRLFTKDELPAGSYVVIGQGWKIRPESFVVNENGELATHKNRPSEVKASSETTIYQIQNSWDNGFTNVAFNITSDYSMKGNIGDYTEESIDQIFQIYVPYYTEVESVKPKSENESVSILGLQMLTDTEMGLQQGKYWYCDTDAEIHGNNSFYATRKFTQSELPIGTVIELELGWQYRPENWINDTKIKTRPSNVTTYRFVVDEDFWEENMTRAFNISKLSNETMSMDDWDDVVSAFKIYVPSTSTLYNK